MGYTSLLFTYLLTLLTIWLDDEGYKLQQAIRQLHVGYLHKLWTSKKILIFLLIIKSLKNVWNFNIRLYM